MTKPCGRPITTQGAEVECPWPRKKGKQTCEWHWMARQPVEYQIDAARRRLLVREAAEGYIMRARVPAAGWPKLKRWCAGCQTFVPQFYVTGSRCRACSAMATHGGRIEKLYGIDEATYDRLLKLQGGRCAICGRKPGKKRLAVDHDHKTNRVRGLLCANNENGCNRGVVANLEAAVDSGVDAARRAVAYLERPPMELLGNGHPWYHWEPVRVVDSGERPPF